MNSSLVNLSKTKTMIDPELEDGIFDYFTEHPSSAQVRGVYGVYEDYDDEE